MEESRQTSRQRTGHARVFESETCQRETADEAMRG
jgi:hypothetical protein